MLKRFHWVSVPFYAFYFIAHLLTVGDLDYHDELIQYVPNLNRDSQVHRYTRKINNVILINTMTFMQCIIC